MRNPLLFAILLLPIFFSPLAAFANDIPFSIRQAIVQVECGPRRGSGVVINGEKGYVLTNAHILVNLDTMTPVPRCEVGFVSDATLTPNIFYHATWKMYAYDESINRDVAILQIGEPEQQNRLGVFPFLKTDEFSSEGEPLSVVSYPSLAEGKQWTTSGTILALEDGLVKTDAEISAGSSGGAGLNSQNNLIGIADRILSRIIEPGVEQIVDYEFVDIRAVLNWLDTTGPNAHDNFVTHADYEKYHGPTGYITQKNLECSLIARSPLADTVFCLQQDGTRSVFPNAATYFSWFGDFSGVVTLSPEGLAPYRLAGSVTMKPGSLVKIQTDPKVYLVTDNNGTLRWLQNESIAKQLYGDGWAGFVKDVPDEFFANYHVDAPIT